MTTNVPNVTWSPSGFVAPSESTILAGVQQDMNTAFGGNLNFGTTGGSQTNASPQGQLAASMAAIIGNVNDTFLFYSTQTDPSFAEGRMQDAIGRIYFIERNGPLPTTLQVQCVGAIGTLIPIGALVVDPGGNLYGSLTGGTIDITGSIQLTFTCTVSGSVSVPNSVAIYQTISGWDTATLLSGVSGQNTETRAAFEQRRALSTAANSLGSLPSVLGTVLSVPGVLQALVFENTNASPLVVNSVTLAPNSVYVAAYGGDKTQVARAIWSKKAPGCAYGGGNTTVQVQDTSPGYSPPYPTYTVTYQIPNPLQLLFSVSIVNSVQVPANATTLIQNAIINAAAGNPNAQNVVDGPNVSIGSKIWASRFVPSIAALGTWAQGNVISIQIGCNNDPDAASGFGYCTGTSAYITTLTTGTISAGQYITISNGSGVVIPGTNIVTQVSGTAGSSGVYTTDVNQSVGLVNLLTQSNTFNNAGSWLLNSCTVTASSGISPDGTNDAWLWQRTGTVGNGYATQAITSVNGKPASSNTYTFSVYAHAGTGVYCAIGFSDNVANGLQVTFNLQTGLISNSVTPFGTFPTGNASIQNVGGGWYRCIVTWLSSSISTLSVNISGNSNNGNYSNGDSISSNILIYGAQLDVGSVANPYIATTTTQGITTVLGFALPNQTNVQVHLDQIPQVAAGNIAVSFV